jgi:uncharacterized protein YfaS (alpha-2-macroglobulin family)
MGVVAALALAVPAVADEPPPVPERRLVLSENVDFYGGDLRSIFDTTLAACRAACLSDPACRAFTFNARNGSCFPKAAAGERRFYEGAISGEVLGTDPAVLAAAPARRAELSFLRPADLEGARRLAETLGDGLRLEPFSAEDYLAAADRERAAGNREAALGFHAAAVLLADRSDLWTRYAEALLALPDGDYSTTQRNRQEALAAAINGYLRALTAPERAAALVPMARALEETFRGRDSVPALRLAAELSPRADILALRDRAVAQFGFRITEHVVESDPAEPRICAQFSEPLIPAGVDYAPFVQIDGSGFAVEPADQRLCIAGVRHGQSYRVTFRAGLPAASGEVLAGPVTLDLYVRDRTPSVRFPGRGYVLPSGGEAAVPVVTVNATALDLVLRRVSDRNLLRAMQTDLFGRPVDQWQEEMFAGALSEEVWRGTGHVESVLNADVTTRLPLGEVVGGGGLGPGVYALSARVAGADPFQTAAAVQWFVISDIGLATIGGVDGLHVFARSLATAEPVAGLTVTLLSRSNRVLGQTTTDAEGHAAFDAGLARGTGGAAPALVTAERPGEDFAFLSLTEPEFDLSDRGVAGREAPGPIDVFVTTDRGAYRAGETIRLTALARDGEGHAIEGLPLVAILTRPDGVEYARALAAESVAGGHVFALPVAASAPRGAWSIGIHADPDAPALARTTVLVEDFLPERIAVEATLPEGPLTIADRVEVQVTARYLFGAPGADLAVTGNAEVRPVRSLPAFPGFEFGRHDAPSEARFGGFAETRTDAGGKAALALALPAFELVDRPLELAVTVAVAEGAGRPVERRVTRMLDPAGALIGIRPLFDGVAPEGAEARFEVIAVGPGGARTALPVRWVLNRVQTDYQWYQSYGGWYWEPMTTRSRVASGEAVLSPDGAVTLAAPVEWGEYELRVERADGGPFAAASVSFFAGWYAPADATETPDTLSLSLDKPAYRPGETAVVRIVPRFAGKGLVAVVSNRLIAMQAVDLGEGENLIKLPVTDEWGSGAYVTATLLRPMAAAAGRNPARALGLAHAAVDPGPRRLSARFEVPAAADPRSPLDVVLRVEGVAPGETAHATIAAVDVGILNLTGFSSPDPQGHYFGQRRLGVALRDLYGRLIDGMTGAMGEVRSGGDAVLDRLQGEPPTEDLLVFFEGPVAVGPDGLARVRFDLPAFNGTVRLMAVVWSPTGVGQAEAEVLVRDPVVIATAAPRFLAPGDASRILVELTHTSGPAGRMGLTVTAEGLEVSPGVPQAVELGPGGRAALSLPMVAGAVGEHRVELALTTPDGRVLTRALTLSVRRNDPEVARQFRFALAPGQTFTFDDAVFAGLVPGTGTATLSAGPLARFDAPGLLAALDRFPYGCTEQIASAAMPLLYFDEVAEAMGMSTSATARERVGQAIAAVLTNQAANGAFGLWGPGSGDLWLDAFVTDFLARARAHGHAVPDRPFRTALENLLNSVNYYPDFDQGGQDLAYALFVLAREGAAAVGDLRYYADVKGDAFATPLAAAQLGAALAAYGDSTRADAMFARAERLLDAPEDETLWRSDFGTRLRDAAGVLTLAAEAGSRAVDREALAARIAAAGAERSTQEALWTLLAAHALIEAPAARLTVDGARLDGPLVRVRADRAAAAPLRIGNAGAADEELTLTVFGVPDEPEPAGGNGWRIDRRYYTMEGEAADPARVAAGTRLVTVLEVTPLGAREARLMVADALPAGFEIDNPNLLAAGDIRALDWLDATAEAAHTEARLDRFLAAIDHSGDQPFRLAYIVRAVSPGTFHHPAASVMDMYRPAFRARTAAGTVTVTE